MASPIQSFLIQQDRISFKLKSQVFLWVCQCQHLWKSGLLAYKDSEKFCTFEVLKPWKSRLSVSPMELMSLDAGCGTLSKGNEFYLSAELARFSLFLLLLQGFYFSTRNSQLRKIKVHAKSFWKDTTQPVKESWLKYDIEEIFLS